MTEVFFDTNAICGLLREDYAERRVRLGHAVSSGSLRVLGSLDVLEEIARIANNAPEYYKRVVSFFWDVTGPFILFPTAKRILLELQFGGALEANDRFLPWTFCQDLKRQLADPAFAAELGHAVYEKVTKARDSEARRRQSVLDAIRVGLDGVKPSQLSSGYWAESAVRVDDWMGDYIRNNRELLGLDDDPGSWPGPRSLPTAWRMHAYMLTRMVLTVGLGRKIGTGDSYDAHHYASASYADVFVSDDGPLHETISRAPLVKVGVKTLPQFFAELYER